MSKCPCRGLLGYLMDFVKRKEVQECSSGGGYLQYTECKCTKCGREWDEQ